MSAAKSSSKNGPTPKRPTKAQSISTRKGAPRTAGQGTTPAAQPHTDVPSRRALRALHWALTRAGQWAVALIFAVIHLASVQYAVGSGALALASAAYAIPAVTILICRPASRRRFYRFPIPLVLAYIAYLDYQVTIYLLAMVWLIRQSWFIDTHPGDRTPLGACRALFARMRRGI